jgi:hypothetical protein
MITRGQVHDMEQQEFEFNDTHTQRMPNQANNPASNRPTNRPANESTNQPSKPTTHPATQQPTDQSSRPLPQTHPYEITPGRRVSTKGSLSRGTPCSKTQSRPRWAASRPMHTAVYRCSTSSRYMEMPAVTARLWQGVCGSDAKILLFASCSGWQASAEKQGKHPGYTTGSGTTAATKGEAS